MAIEDVNDIFTHTARIRETARRYLEKAPQPDTVGAESEG